MFFRAKTSRGRFFELCDEYSDPVNTDICDQLIKYRVFQCSLHLLEQETVESGKSFKSLC
jgi:hypothetical protein